MQINLYIKTKKKHFKVDFIKVFIVLTTIGLFRMITHKPTIINYATYTIKTGDTLWNM